MTATIPQAAMDAAVAAAAGGIAGYQGFSLSTMEAGPRSLIEQDALAAVIAATPIIAAAEREQIAEAIEAAARAATWSYDEDGEGLEEQYAYRQAAAIARAEPTPTT